MATEAQQAIHGLWFAYVCLEKVIMSYQFLLWQDFQDGLASRRPQIHHIMDGTPPRVRSLMPRTTSSTHGWRNVITTSGPAGFVASVGGTVCLEGRNPQTSGRSGRSEKNDRTYPENLQDIQDIQVSINGFVCRVPLDFMVYHRVPDISPLVLWCYHFRGIPDDKSISKDIQC